MLTSVPRSKTVFYLQLAFKLALSMVLFYWLALWDARSAADESPDTDDITLLEALDLGVDHSARADLSHFDRAGFMSFLGQLEILDRASREV